jgi:hypothetical protein
MAEIDARIPLMFDTGTIFDPNKAEAEKLALQKSKFEQSMQPFQRQKAMDEQAINGLKVAAAKTDQALKLLDAAQDPAAWAQVRAGIIENGLAKPNEIPEMYSPAFVQKARMAHMDLKDKLDNQFRNAQLALQREDLGEKRADRREGRELQSRYYDILEKNAQTKAGQMVDPDTGEIVSTKKNVQLPVGALKLQEEALDNLATARSVDADLGAFQDQLGEGKLNLSLGKNLESRARNFVGNSNEESRNFSSFKAGLEKLRNDSLRLNKGVQTEGDAVRAWNELFANINDQEVVAQRLEEIRNINKRAAGVQKSKIKNLRQNYGADDLDYSGFEDVKAAPVGGKSTNAGGWSIEPVD